MSAETQKLAYPPFLDELAEDAILDAAIFRGSVVGASKIKRVISTIASYYATQSYWLHTNVDKVELAGYVALLDDGQELQGLVTITRNAEGKVSHVGSMMRPLGSVLTVAARIRAALGDEIEAVLYL